MANPEITAQVAAFPGAKAPNSVRAGLAAAMGPTAMDPSSGRFVCESARAEYRGWTPRTTVRSARRRI